MHSFFARNLKRRYPVVASAQGVWLTDTDGNRYLDGCSGAVAANLGHGLSEVNEAVRRQLERVAFAHTSQFVSEPALQLAERLLSVAPSSFKGGRVFFCSGGSEAVESALKLARGYQCQLDAESPRTVIVSRWNSYHGATLGALSATGHPARRKPYLPLLAETPHIGPVYPYRCPCGAPGRCESNACSIARADELEALVARLGAENILAFIAEPVVGAAMGAVAPHSEYWKRIREICTAHGILLIADEVMTGLGRCGANFALDLWGVEPDIIVAGKGLAAGYMPLAAVLASQRIAAAFEEGTGIFEHGFTYSGHPLSCAAGLAAVDYLLDQDLPNRVAQRSAQLECAMEDLREFEFVGDVRGKGFLRGIEFVADRSTKAPFDSAVAFARQVADAALEQGLLVYPGSGFVEGAGDHIIVAPPLTITDAAMETLFTKLKAALVRVKEKTHDYDKGAKRQKCGDDVALLRTRGAD